ncbi:hypothetical protein AB0E10_30540 [Streptomyces sp. NPDC048045]|uniref:hypothetical protein n=1 Tax=Streptomyces sp. NPDC048045 TaxID=3154710 RepID=UPI003417E96C
MSAVPPPEGPDGGADEQPSISDEQWAAFLREAAEGDGAAAPKEPSARARMVERRLRDRFEAEQAEPKARKPKRRPFGERARAAIPWTAAAAVVLVGAYQQNLLSWGGPPASGPAKAVALPEGGVTDGDQCGVKGYHHFPLPAAASSPAPKSTGVPTGPQLALGSYGYARLSPRTPGRFTIELLFAPGPKGSLKVARTLGGEGAAVEIEGPHGLVGGAHGLPVTWTPAARADAEDKTRIELNGGPGAEVSLPVQALCPGYDGNAVMKNLQAPIDSSNTITGQPAYTLTVSVRDPAIGELRTSVGLPAGGNLLSVNNLEPDGP